MQNEPIEVTLKVTGALEKMGVPYIIGGSLANTLYGMVRSTQDSDVIAELRFEHIQPFISALQKEFFIDEEMIASAVQHNSSFNIIHGRLCSRWMSLSQACVPSRSLKLLAPKDKPLTLNL